MASIQQVGEQLRDPNGQFDINLLQQLIATAFNPHAPQRAEANKVLTDMKEDPGMFTRAAMILEQTKDPNTRFFGLQILDNVIQTRWRVLPQEQREGVKNYIVQTIIASTTHEVPASERVFVNKMDQVLVAILKQEWPHNWPTFISDIVGASKTSEILCENNMQILKLLSEEVFDFSKDQMTTAKIRTMKHSLNGEFAKIYQLCEFILDNSTRTSLLNTTLQTLQRFITWIPLGFIFETNIISTLLNKFFPTAAFRQGALDCMTEIASLSTEGDLVKYDPVLSQLFQNLMVKLTAIIPPDADLAGPFESATESEQVFVKKLALFFTSFFKEHLTCLETPETQAAMLAGLVYLVRISEVPDDEIFKICLEFYHTWTGDLYQSEPKLPTHMASSPFGFGAAPVSSGRKALYREVLSRIRHVLITHMAKPEEVLIVEDENGEIVRETTKDTEAIAQYKTMRETLVYLTNLHYEDTEAIMLEKLAMQVDGREFSWHSLNTLCWAIGSISGSMGVEEEKRFLVTVIKDLLNLCEMKRGKDNKAVIASNIMYVVGQYPRFLKEHWKFLRTVVNKLFEFMHELHPGVQDMACDTFLKIAQKCKLKFVMLQSGEPCPFIEDLLTQLPTIVSDLETHQVHTFYEAVACMLSLKGNDVGVDRKAMLGRLMSAPNTQWRTVMSRCKAQPETIMAPDTVKEVTKILRTNTRVCQAAGPIYVNQLQAFFQELLGVYRFYSERISTEVATQGELATRHSAIRSLRGAKKEALKLLTTFVEKSGDTDSPPEVVAQHYIPQMLDPILGDYQRGIPTARDAEVLNLFAVAVNQLKKNVQAVVPQVMAAIFGCTLQMIQNNFEDFPEHRLKFYEFLKAVNTNCFEALFMIPPEDQGKVVQSVIWAFQHRDRNIAEMGLDILLELLKNVEQQPEAMAQAFFQTYLLTFITELLNVLTDRLHKSGFKMQATLLRHMYHLIAENKILLPLGSTQAPLPQANRNIVAEHTGSVLKQQVPHLTRQQVVTFVNGLFDLSMDLQTFKQHLRDFLITIKEFQSEDNADLYYEETLAQKQAADAQLRASKLAVPGLVNPHERPEEDMADL